MIELEEQVSIKQEQVDPRKHEKHVSTMQIRRGHKLFSYNIRTGDLKEVEIERMMLIEKVNGKMKSIRKGKAIWDDKCMYFTNLNEKNAIKTVTKRLAQIGLEYKIVP